MGVILVHQYYPFDVSLHRFIGYHLCEFRIHSYLVHIMHEFLFPNVNKLGAIFISSKIRINAIKTFPWIFPYSYFSGVLTIIGF